jgi:hypothetical protein
MKQRLVKLLAARHTPLVAALLGMLLSLPSLDDGFVSDDRVLRLFASRGMTDVLGERAPYDLFRIVDGEEAVRLQIELGALPWWTSPELRMSFFRPLSSLTHWLDFQLFPDVPWLMHAENVLLYGLLILAVAALVRRIEGSERAALVGLVTLLYAIDDGHGMPIGWIANRNALIAAAFGMLSVERYAAASAREGAARTRTELASAGLLALSLASAEAGLGTLAYLGAYVLVLHPGSLGARARSLLGHAGVLVVWGIAYVTTRSGARSSGMYLDPVHDAGAFLAALPERVLFLLQGQLGFPPSDIVVLVPPDLAWLWLPIIALTAALTLLVFWPWLRRDPKARFWGVGALVACLPVAATFPSDRLLLYCGVGAFALVARVLLAPVEHVADEAWVHRLFLRGAAVTFFVLHLVVAPLLLPVRVSAIELLLGRAQARAVASFPDATGGEVVVANAPDWFVVAYGVMGSYLERGSTPAAVHLLGVTFAPVEIERVSDRELLVRPGRPYFEDPISQSVRRLSTLRVGDRVERSTATTEILELDDAGHPTLVRWTFRTSIDALQWVTWEGDRLVRLEPPAIGATVTTPPIDPATALFTPAE